jgi:hypothetical protein
MIVPPEAYAKAQSGLASLKSAVQHLLAANPDGLTNVEIGRSLGIYRGHGEPGKHEGHVSRTILAMLATDGIAEMGEDKRWRNLH